MSAWVNLAALSVNATAGNVYNQATKRQVGAVAGYLGKLIVGVMANHFGLSAGTPYIRDLRLQFLGNVCARQVASASQLSFGEATAILDWLTGSSAAEDMAAWLAEQDLPHSSTFSI